MIACRESLTCLKAIKQVQFVFDWNMLNTVNLNIWKYDNLLLSGKTAIAQSKFLGTWCLASPLGAVSLEKLANSLTIIQIQILYYPHGMNKQGE